MQTSLSRRSGLVAATLLIVVLIAGLLGCTNPNATHNAHAKSSDHAHASLSGPVSAKLPSHDPEVLVKNPRSKATRILALDRAGALSRMVWAFGMGSELIGRDIASDFPGIMDRPLVTPGGHAINPETVLALKPELVITDGTIGPSRVFRKLEDAGITVVRISDERTPNTIADFVDEVGNALGMPDDAKVVKDSVAKQLERATTDAKKRADGRRMLVLYVRGTGVALIAGPKSGGTELVERLGGVDAGAELGLEKAFVPMTPEALIAAAPDTVIVMTGGLKSVGGIEGLKEIPGIAQTPAGMNNSVLDVPDSQLLSFGTQTPTVIDAMADALYEAK